MQSYFESLGLPDERFLQRIITIAGAQVLTGIRFYGGDIQRPFVDVLCWTTFPSLLDLIDAVREEWSEFHPLHLRLLAGLDDLPGLILDQTVHFGWVRDIARLSCPAPITLRPCEDTAEAEKVMFNWYDQLAVENPALRNEVTPASREELDECAEAGTVHWIVHDGEIVGLIATLPDTIEMISGHVLIEEVIAPDARGKGFAVAAQVQVARHLQDRTPAGLMIGTIQRLNRSSRRAAEKAGRPAVMAFRFADL